MANEFFSHDSIQQYIHELSNKCCSLIFEKQSLDIVVDYLKDFSNINQNDKENMDKIWRDIIEKYKDELGQNNEIGTIWHLPMIFLRINFTKIICDNILETIEAIKSN